MNQEFDDSGATKILAGLLQARTGQLIAPNRFWRIETSLKPVLQKYSIPDLDTLVAVLLGTNNEDILREAIDAMLNNESYFFRDTAMFELLRSQVLPKLQAARAATKTLRLWSAGCSTGQEAYSLAMLIADQSTRWHGWKVEIVATDISATVLEKARTGSYTQFEIQRGLSVASMLRYFKQKDENWCIDETIRQKVQFREDNVLRPNADRGQFDLVLCRNVLMYFSPDMRRIAFSRLARATRSDGYLMLGAAETAMGNTDSFAPCREIRGVYQPVEDQSVQARSPFLGSAVGIGKG